MERYDYGTDRWKIICGSYSGMEQRAVELIYGRVSQEVPYILVAQTADQCAEKQEDNLILVGTRESNPLIAQLVGESEIPQGGYLVKVTDSPFCGGRQAAVITGSDAASVYYGATDFADDYLAYAKLTDQHSPFFQKLFQGRMKPYRSEGAPKIAQRGIWTWGHCIYDYRRFAAAMARLRLNQIVIWNDYAPLNLREVVECFHSYGIRVIFGYSWGWDEKINVTSEEELECWAEKVLAVYRRDYAQAGGDGIYFQSFTETKEETINGIPIADAVKRWVNFIGGRLLEQYPGLAIQFGLHATSVKNRVPVLAGIRPEIDIVWEDCGSFPYDYLPGDIQDFENTKAFTEQILSLRPGSPCGVVLKGQICLDWSIFEHQKGPFVMGCESQAKIEKRMEKAKEIWHFIQSDWFRNGRLCQEIIRMLCEGGAEVNALVEDGLLESKCWFPVALYAQMLWDCTEDFDGIVRRVSQRENVVMA